MAEQMLDAKKQEWIEQRLNEWGAWVFSGLDLENRMNMIAKLMQKADPNLITQSTREMCNDELGLLISNLVGYCIKQPCPQDFKYLEAKYVYGSSIYAIAKWQWQKDKSKSLSTWKRAVKESINASEWILAKFLDLAIKNHKNAIKLQKFAFNV